MPEPVAGPGVDAPVTAEDFGCYRDWPRIGHSWYGNVLGDVDATVAAAENQTEFPVGSIVHLAPVEGMVKRHQGFSPETGDWEFFKLKVPKNGQTVIVERGTTDIRNPAGGCADCHAGAAETNDWVCSTEFGCDPLPGFILPRAEKMVANDPRCASE